MFSGKKKEEYVRLEIPSVFDRRKEILDSLNGVEVMVKNHCRRPISHTEELNLGGEYLSGILVTRGEKMRDDEYGLIINHVITSTLFKFKIEELEGLCVPSEYARHFH